MPEQSAPVLITAVDFTADAVHVTFTGGAFSVYKATFLFAARTQVDNLIAFEEPVP